MSMAGRKHALEFLPQFEEDLREAIDYIRLTLRNPTAAGKLLDDAFDAIYERQSAPESFEPYPSKLDREHPYYRIPVGNFIVLYVVIGNVMEVRRFIYARRNWQAWPL